eukprot:gb/GEZN01004529.1/.p1 GENE.gb/GEZN01004529.1/~~gb/GEZN01004529.1/.p1  ORF type:complete len:649 (-),score=134.51 gb/GEZN01004529.1/:6-1670(-)
MTRSIFEPFNIKIIRASSSRTLSNLQTADNSIVPGLTEPDALEAERLSNEYENMLVETIKTPTELKLTDLAPMVRRGMLTVVQDDFSKCFESAQSEPWNWNAYLFPIWCMGVLFRYCFLFPIRCVILLLGLVIFFLGLLVGRLTCKTKKAKTLHDRKMASFLAYMFVFSWTGVVKYHGTPQARKPNRIWVANHTSMIDIMVLLTVNSYALVGQKHYGWIGGMQHALDGLGCLWFDRQETRDRAMASAKIKAHIHQPDGNRLLVFPEGTCVNNKYCVQFKRGVFGMDAEICPIAIKYNMIFADAFWNSRVESFAGHLVRLMCSWAVVCDVYFLPPQNIRPGETDIEFSHRVKALISKKAGLKDVPWDGYLKHFKPSGRYLQENQKHYAQSLLKGLTLRAAEEELQQKKLLLRGTLPITSSDNHAKYGTHNVNTNLPSVIREKRITPANTLSLMKETKIYLHNPSSDGKSGGSHESLRAVPEGKEEVKQGRGLHDSLGAVPEDKEEVKERGGTQEEEEDEEEEKKKKKKKNKQKNTEEEEEEKEKKKKKKKKKNKK